MKKLNKSMAVIMIIVIFSTMVQIPYSTVYAKLPIDKLKNIFYNADNNEDKNNKDTEDTIVMNSLYTLNYINFITVEILNSSNRLETIERINENISYNMNFKVDEQTQELLVNLKNNLEILDKIYTKKEQVNYLYNKGWAQKVKETLPNSRVFLEVFDSKDSVTLAANAIYIVVDSLINYYDCKEREEIEKLQSQCEIDEEELEKIKDIKNEAYEYTFKIVRLYEIPQEYVLSKDDFEDFSLNKEEQNLERKVQFFVNESRESKYQKFGPYWLELAKVYYQKEKYQECLQAIQKYEKLNIQIFQKDYDYINVLPLAVVSVQKVYSGRNYENKLNYYIDQIKNNRKSKDWRLSYICAQTEIELYSKTQKLNYIKDAYSLIVDNINYLVHVQKKNNEEYLSNNNANQLPPVYEPLLLNYNLLKSLVIIREENNEKIDSEKEHMDGILHGTADESLFLTAFVDEYFWFDKSKYKSKKNEEISISETQIIIPVSLLSEMSEVTLTIHTGKKDRYYKNLKLDEVRREKKGDINSFYAVYKLSKDKKFNYKDSSKATVIIKDESNTKNGIHKYKFNVTSELRIDFWNDYYNFERDK